MSRILRTCTAAHFSTMCSLDNLLKRMFFLSFQSMFFGNMFDMLFWTFWLFYFLGTFFKTQNKNNAG